VGDIAPLASPARPSRASEQATGRDEENYVIALSWTAQPPGESLDVARGPAVERVADLDLHVLAHADLVRCQAGIQSLCSAHAGRRYSVHAVTWSSWWRAVE
jgi:hypothetical protein